jgi:hypothetical protein
MVVAHLLLADHEIKDPRHLPEPTPWTFALVRVEGQPLRLWADMDIREEEQRIKARLERALFALQQPPVDLPPQYATLKRREKKAAHRRAAAARDTVYRLLNEHIDTHNEVVYLVDAWQVDIRVLRPLVESAAGPLLIGHNAAFDLRFLLAKDLAVPSGVRVFDTQIAA